MSTRSTPSLVTITLLVAGLAMLAPFSLDTYLPSFPGIEQNLSATPNLFIIELVILLVILLSHF